MWPFRRDLTAQRYKLISDQLDGLTKTIHADFSLLTLKVAKMDAAQARLQTALDDMKSEVDSIVTQHTTDVQAQIDAAVKAKQDDDDAAFDQATAKATDILNSLKAKMANVGSDVSSGTETPPASIPAQSPVGISSSGPETAAIPDPALTSPTAPGAQDSADAATAAANPPPPEGAVSTTAPVVATSQPSPPDASPVVPAASVGLQPATEAPNAPEAQAPATPQAPPLNTSSSE